MIIWSIIPVKTLSDSKSRLAHVLSSAQRVKLTQYFLTRTLQILKDIDLISNTLVVSRDPQALKVARSGGAATYREREKHDLNRALTGASQIAAANGADGILVLPADLPFLTVEDVEQVINPLNADTVIENSRTDTFINTGSQFYPQRCMAICSDHAGTGTNALLLCPPSGFRFQYGRDSYIRHLEEASRLGMVAEAIKAPGIKFDIDTEEDWLAYLELEMNPVISNQSTR